MDLSTAPLEVIIVLGSIPPTLLPKAVTPAVLEAALFDIPVVVKNVDFFVTTGDDGRALRMNDRIESLLAVVGLSARDVSL